MREEQTEEVRVNKDNIPKSDFLSMFSKAGRRLETKFVSLTVNTDKH